MTKKNIYGKLIKTIATIFNKEKISDVFNYKKENDTNKYYREAIIGIDENKQSIKKSMANDANTPIYNNEAYVSETNALLIDNVFMGFAEMANLSTNSILRNIADTLAGDMTRKGFTILNENKEEDKEQIKNTEQKLKQIKTKFKQLKLDKVIKKCLIDTFIYGGSNLYFNINGDNEMQDNTGTFEHENELIINSNNIEKGSLKYLKNVEPMYVYPLGFNASNPASYDFYNPEYFSMMGRTYHRSRLLRFIHMEAPDILKPNYLFYGIPLLQLCIPYAKNFEMIRNNVANIVERFNLSVLGVDMESIANGNQDGEESEIQSGQSLKNRVQGFNAGRTNYNTLVIDKTNESFAQIQIPLTGLDVLLDQAIGFLSMISKIPATKLLGTAPKGLNATGDGDMRNYYDSIRQLQENILLDNLTTLLHLVQLDLFGEIDENLVIEFNNLWDANELEQAQIENTRANTLSTLVAAQILSTNEALKQAVKDPKMNLVDVELPEDMGNDNYMEAYDE